MNRRLRHRVERATLLLVALLLLLVCMPCLARATQMTTTVTVQVRMFQEYKVSVSGLQNTFEYVIEPIEEDAPLPVDADGKNFDKFKLTRDEDLRLEFPVQVTVDPAAKPYVYHYIVKPVQKELSDGLYYVNVLSTSLEAGVNEYLLEIHVQPSSVDAEASIVVPTVHVEEWDGPKVTDPGWRIGYKAIDEDPADKPDESPENTQATPSSSASNLVLAQQTNLSRTSLATTDDSQLDGWALACAAVGGALLTVWASLRLRKAGDHYA